MPGEQRGVSTATNSPHSPHRNSKPGTPGTSSQHSQRDPPPVCPGTPAAHRGSRDTNPSPTCVYPPVGFEVGALGVDLVAALEVALVDAPLLQVRGVGSGSPCRRPAGAGTAGARPRSPRGPGGLGEKGWGGTGSRTLTLSAGPGRALGRSRRRCPRCRCSCPWGTRSLGPSSREGSGKGKLRGTKRQGVNTQQRHPQKHPPHIGGSAFLLLPRCPEHCPFLQRTKSNWAHGEPPKGRNNLGAPLLAACSCPEQGRSRLPTPDKVGSWECPGKGDCGGHKGAAELKPELLAAGSQWEGQGRLPTAGWVEDRQCHALCVPALPMSPGGHRLGAGGFCMKAAHGGGRDATQ